jgi:hypothetical protein
MTKTPKITLPAEPPKTLWDKVLAYSPVVMTVIATLLAGMSNSELSAAQYERSAAAQYQSKAGDEWNYFQVKKIRGSAMEMTVDVLAGLSQAGAFDAGRLAASAGRWGPRAAAAVKDVHNGTADLKAEGDQRVLVDADRARLLADAEVFGGECAGIPHLLKTPGTLEAIGGATTGPDFAPIPIHDPKIRAATEAIAANKPEVEIAALVREVDAHAWEEEMKTFQTRSAALDAATGPTSKALESLRPELERLCAAANSCARVARELAEAEPAAELQVRSGAVRLTALAAEVQAAAAEFASLRASFGARRYAMEAPLNQRMAELTEIKVHQANAEAEHHRKRSRLFFVGSLIAQAAVIGSTLALAMRKKSLLWGVAAVAGLAALSFGLYVRMFV